MSLVLVVEDNLLNRELMGDLLTASGHRVVGTGDAAGALASVEGELPDLILMDLDLPDMGGLQVLGRLKGAPRTAAIPVVVISGNALPEDIAEAERLGSAHYLVKPIDTRNFRLVVAQLLAARRAAAPRTPQP